MNSPSLSVIIPTRNEQARLPGLIAQLRQQVGVTLEILVADGGSTDQTVAWARQAGVRVVATTPGRGAQMNQAAALACGQDLLFLHADSGLSHPEQLQRALQVMNAKRAVFGPDCAGYFPIDFVEQPPEQGWIWSWFAHKSGLNRPECRNGDQGLLLSRPFFHALGGFWEELPFLEDREIAERITRQGSWVTLPGRLHTSARRFHHEGVVRRVVLNAVIVICFHLRFREFLHQARTLYPAQSETRPVRLLPFFVLLHQLNRQAGWKTACLRWYQAGRMVRQSAWQLFFLLDWLLGWGRQSGRWPLLAFHDRIVHPVTNWFLFDGLAALLLWMLFSLVLLVGACQRRLSFDRSD